MRLQVPSLFTSMVGSTIPVAIIGSRFAMNHQPFWKPESYSTFFPNSVPAQFALLRI